ncbi:MAG TPA: ADP-ribosylglycohydrolase family protein [Tepidisphaeraceae bacterium]|jgi:poly(ADP-ribose) glycohydrolase ARH3
MTASKNHFTGAMLGHALGDALGVPFEGLPAVTIIRDLGGAKRFITQLPIERLHYSDDTQMMIGVAESLIENGRIDLDHLAGRFVENYESWRGYGRGAAHLLEKARQGEPWREMRAFVFPDGSYGNGAAMRATPLGLFFHHDEAKLDTETTQAAVVTHTHPLGIEGAVIFAMAVALAVRSADEPLRQAEFFNQLLTHATHEEFQWQLRTAAAMDLDNPQNFGSSLPAHRSVVSAICCFAQYPDSFTDAVSRAINLGDDTDTVAGMTGALVGARCGPTALPREAFRLLENGRKGRQFIEELASQLHDKWAAQFAVRNFG